jgi:hypothetical protein
MRTMKRSLVVVAMATTAAVAPMSAVLASGPADSGTSDTTPVLVGPLLKIFGFGSDVGIPTGCQAATATLGSGAAYVNQAQNVYQLILAINDGCVTLQQQADSLIAQGQSADQPLTAADGYANPMIQATGDAITAFGTQYNDAIAPFGPTIAGFGATLEYFEGS